jgi:5-methylthioribose kinase
MIGLHPRERFAAEHPTVFLLDSSPEALTRYLRSRGWSESGEELLSVEKAGEGNMNLVMRVVTPQRRLVLKQGRPWVEKYPHIPAPVERTLVEGRFYEVAALTPAVAERMPAYVGLDEESRILALEDVEGARDLTSIYSGEALTDDSRTAVINWLCELHRMRLAEEDRAVFANRAMRALNHQHIFRLPLDPANHLDLDAITPGLAAEARRLQRHAGYVRRATELGRLYLADGPSLVHGDYFPGSWLLGASGIRVIDPEFAFTGPREFDLGVMAAHLCFAGGGEHATTVITELYREPVDERLMRAFAGIELMRRLIGVAQLPLSLDGAAKRRLLELSERLVMET